MEAYIEEVRRLEERFNELQTEHVPRAENNIVDHLSKCAAQKLPVEPGTFVLHLTQPSESPATMASKRRKLDSGKPLPAELPEAPNRELGRNNSPSIGELHPPPNYQSFGRGMCSRQQGGAASPCCRASGSNLGATHSSFPPNMGTSRRARRS